MRENAKYNMQMLVLISKFVSDIVCDMHRFVVRRLGRFWCVFL